jgi:hypothetical protein
MNTKLQLDKSWYELKHFYKNVYYIEDLRGDIVKSFKSLDDALKFIRIFEKHEKQLIPHKTQISYFSRWSDTYEHRQTFLSRLIGGHFDEYIKALRPTEKIDLKNELKKQLDINNIDPAETLYQKTKHIKED